MTTTPYDPDFHRTVVAAPGEISYKHFTINKHVQDMAAAGIISLTTSTTEPVDTSVLWLQITEPQTGNGTVKVYSSGEWVTLTPALFSTYLGVSGGGGGTWGSITGTLSDQSDLQTALNAKQPLDSDLTDIAALTTTSYGRSLLELADAAAGRTALGVDAAGTDNSTDVTLAGTPDYITISGQVITRNAVDLAADVTGQLPLANGGTGANLVAPGADRVLFWDHSALAFTWLTVGTGLTITDTTIEASGSSGAAAGDIVLGFDATPQSGFVELDGATISGGAATYPIVAARYPWMVSSGDIILPDARGRFFRIWADGSDNDPNRATRTARAGDGQTGDYPGTYQDDEFKQHNHGHGSTSNLAANGTDRPIPFAQNRANTTNTGGSETRPKNIAVSAQMKMG